MPPFLKTKNRLFYAFFYDSAPSSFSNPPSALSLCFFPFPPLIFRPLPLALFPLLLRLASFHKKTRTLSRSETVRVSLSQIMFSKISLSATSAMNSLFVGFSVPR